jgi:hypothetical protein
MSINETIAEVLRLDEEATQGPWYPQATDDRLCMNASYVSTDPKSGLRDMDPQSAERDCRPGSVVAITLLQSPRLANVRDQRWDENTDLIAYYRTAAPALAREVKRLQAEVCEARIGHDCAIVAAYESGRRAGQEAMRERCLQACEDIILFSRSAEGIHLAADMRCMRSHLLQAIRALEVSHD